MEEGEEKEEEELLLMITPLTRDLTEDNHEFAS